MRHFALLILMLLAACTISEEQVGELTFTSNYSESDLVVEKGGETTITLRIDDSLDVGFSIESDGITLEPLRSGEDYVLTFGFTNASVGQQDAVVTFFQGKQSGELTLSFTVFELNLNFADALAFVNESVQMPIGISAEGVEASAFTLGVDAASEVMVSLDEQSVLVTTVAACICEITVTAYLYGNAAASATALLTVQALPEIKLTVSPRVLSIRQGDTSSISLRADITHSTEIPTLHLDNGVQGLLINYPRALDGDGVMSVSATESVTPGSYVLILDASVDKASTSETIAVNVLEKEDYQVSIEPAELFIDAGSSASATISSTTTGDMDEEVAVYLSGVPAGMTVDVGNFVTGQQAIIRVSTQDSIQGGSYQLELTFLANGIERKSLLTIVVEEKQDFELFALTETLSLEAGESGVILINAQGNTSSPIQLLVTGLPAGTTAGTAVVTTGTTAAISVNSLGTTLPGTYALTVTGIGDGVSKAVSTTLIVTAPPQAGSISLIASPQRLVLAPEEHTGFFTVLIEKQNFDGAVVLELSRATGNLPAWIEANNEVSSLSSVRLNFELLERPQGIFQFTIRGSNVTGEIVAEVPVELELP